MGSDMRSKMNVKVWKSIMIQREFMMVLYTLGLVDKAFMSMEYGTSIWYQGELM